MKTQGRPQKTYTEEEKSEIKKAYKKTHNPKDRSILLCVKLRIVNKLSTEEISKITEYSLSRVSHLISLYNRYGIEKLAIKKYGGNHRNMTLEEEKEFLEPFRQQALAGEILEVSEIIDAYANKLNKKVSKSTGYDLLHRHDWRKVMPRSEHPNKANDEVIEAYKKMFGKIVELGEYCTQVNKSFRLMFQDEAGFGCINKPKRCWCGDGIRPTVPCHRVRKYMYAYGAVSPLDGDMVSLILPKCNTQCMSIFLDEVSKQYPMIIF